VRTARREGYQRHLIRFTKNGLSFDGERVDLVLYNSHDCGCAFKLIASVWRKWGAPHFRQTAATQLNKVAGTTITQEVLGHARRQNTLRYAHLNPDQYAVYMKRHPFMQEV